MGTKQLLKLLEHIGKIYSHDYSLYIKIKELVFKNEAVVVTSEWYNNYRNMREIPLTNSKAWLTFDTCIDLEFKIVDERLVVKVRVFNGEMVYGKRDGLRFTASVVVPSDFINQIKISIEYALEMEAEAMYESHLLAMQHRWESKYKQKILSKCSS